MSKSQAIMMKAIDNVATATQEILPGTDITVTIDGAMAGIHVTEKIPFGHKVAIREIAKGDKIIKYGEVIGEATAHIHPGQHTHVHNLGGCRGRGDLSDG
ncbi:UxaA family hydrolase [Sporomusa sphaeroides DSM 2875]|uniref:UxaA family hydrolase n=1 Tax=Sporomusa sphaeroides TaxID=47679 RepID=UPI00202FA6F9|nr:UxaA family hydrolase [Sporomusa sphaeroides]MCM0757632.1 UxaA family hydrolase [Sporomusa sphaeroides DSM 2875]